MKKDILTFIDHNIADFSKGQKQIAAYVRENYDKAAYMTAAKLGREVGVSESTVVRFVLEFGFEGYPEFQKALQELIRAKLTSVQRVEVTDNLIGNSNVLDKVLGSDIEKIKNTLEGIDRRSFDDAVKQITSAKNIYILGMKASSYLAGFLNYGLRMMLDNVRLIQTTSGVEMFEQLLGIGKDDVVIAISFPRYSKAVIKAVEMAKEAGADVIAVTDSESAPIARNACEALVSQSDMASFMDSLVAPISIINAIVVEITNRKEREITDRFDKLEALWDEYDVYTKR